MPRKRLVIILKDDIVERILAEENLEVLVIDDDTWEILPDDLTRFESMIERNTKGQLLDDGYRFAHIEDVVVNSKEIGRLFGEFKISNLEKL